MKPISLRPLFTLSFFSPSNQKIIKNSNFLAFSTQTHQNSNYQRRYEEESRAVRVSVWWDFENCQIPVNTNAFRVAQCITNAVRANGIKGPIQITAFGDVMQISRTNQEALSSTGINLTHVPAGGKNSADRSLLVDLMYWVSQNPPPAHLFLISGDRDFAGILHRLRMNNYNILLASHDDAPSVLCSAATLMWQWSSLLRGEKLMGKLFNHPPDGPYHSCYGHYKTPLEDPFAFTEQSLCLVTDKSCDAASDSKLQSIPKAITEQSSCLGTDESSDMAQNSKFRPIPKTVMKYICHVLRSHPEGIAISQLRQVLNKSSLTIDRDLYGYKKFSRFISAMPHILAIHSGNDGQILVRGVNTKFLDESVPAANGEPEAGSVSSEDVTEKSSIHPAPDPKVIADITNLQETGREEKQNESSPSMKMQGKMEVRAANLQNLIKEKNQKASLPNGNTQEMHEQDRDVNMEKKQEKVEVVPPGVEIKDLSGMNEEKILVPNDHSSAVKFGIFRRLWMKLVGSRDPKYDKASIVETLKPCQSYEFVRPALFSPSSHEALIDGKISQIGDSISDVSAQGSSFSNRTLSWFRFWSSLVFGDKVEKDVETEHQSEAKSKQLDDKLEKKGETTNNFAVKPKQLDAFAKESFWREMESFMDASQGSASISKSQTREHLAQNLQKQGPPTLQSLSETDLLHLVDLLIYDKKWVEENHTWLFPFRLARPGRKDPDNNHPVSLNGLSHVFSRKQSNQELGDLKHQNATLAGASQPIVRRGSNSKPRSEVLADCEELVDQIVKEHPEGFNIGRFRKLFVKRHGYALDVQKLGYDKLVNLLQIMPGVRIESNYIFPAGALKNLDLQDINPPIGESKVGPVVDSHSDPKEDDDDSSWDELGPIDSSSSEKEEMDMWSTGKSQSRRIEDICHDYEPLKEDDLSDSEDEPTLTSKSKVNEEESNLLDILDSWYVDQGVAGKKNESMDKANVRESHGTGPQPSAPTSSRTKNEPVVTKPTRKHKPGKSYSFVSEQAGDNKDKLVDGILGSLKKSGEKSSDSTVLS